MNNGVSNKSFLSVLFSPAVGLAILGTGAFIFSFYRAGQLAELVLPKELSRINKPAPEGPKIDVNSRDLLIAIDTSIPTTLAKSGDYSRAMTEALKNLTDNSPTDVANLAFAGDIYSAVGNKEDKELGLSLLAKALAMVPGNQYLACRYAERMAANGQLEQAVQKLSQLIKNNSQAKSMHFVLAKIYLLQDKSKEALDQLDKIKDGGQLSAKEQEEAALMFVKMGKTYDGYKLFRLAMSGSPEKRFYASYCRESANSSAEDYKTALSIIDANLNNNPSADKLLLEIKRAVLLLLLDRFKEAKEVLEHSIAKHTDCFDLQVLLAVADFAVGDSDHALSYLELAAKTYQSKL